MGHQCLSCGQSFPDGSPELLKGCPKCQGTRFFYTQAPLAKAERDALMQQANQDLKAILQELVKGSGGEKPRPSYESPVWSPEAREKWLRVDTRKLANHEAGAVEEVASPAAAPPPKPAPKAAPPPPPKTEQVPLPLAQARPQPTSSTPALDDSTPREAKPEVIVVREPGKYDIDVEQLLDHSPIVVRRDGVYVVHLPSAFQMTAKR